MIPRVVVDRIATPAGEMVLSRRGDEFAIRVAGIELMASHNHLSEDELGKIAGAAVTGTRSPRVLIGGLGMGFTLRAALDSLPKLAAVDIVEILPDVVRWNRTVLGHLARAPLDDRRVTVIVDDVARVIRASVGRYDAIVLDVDNGPDGVIERNNGLYQGRGVAAAAAALVPGGLLAVWSSFQSATFTRWLREAGFDVDLQTVKAHGARYYIWLARLPPLKPQPRGPSKPEPGSSTAGPRGPSKPGAPKPGPRGPSSPGATSAATKRPGSTKRGSAKPGASKRR